MFLVGPAVDPLHVTVSGLFTFDRSSRHISLSHVTLQEDSARMMLFRGADHCIMNYANQTAAEVAIIADNVHISDLISNFKTSDVGKPVLAVLFLTLVIAGQIAVLVMFVCLFVCLLP